MIVLIGSVAVLLLTLKLVTMTSAYLKDWDARFNHHVQWPVRTSSWSAVSSRSCIPSILTAGRTGMVEGGSSGSLSLGHRVVQRGHALPALPALLSSLSASQGEGRWDVPLPCPTPCPRPLPAHLAAKANSSVVDHLSWQWEKSCPSFLLHICWVRVCLPPQLKTLVYIV